MWLALISIPSLLSHTPHMFSYT